MSMLCLSNGLIFNKAILLKNPCITVGIRKTDRDIIGTLISKEASGRHVNSHGKIISIKM